MRIMVALVIASVAVLQAPGSAASPPPAPVTSALAGFPADPAAAMAAWTGWAASQPMSYTSSTTAPTGRAACRIDAAQVSRCLYSAEVIGRGGRNMGIKPISEVVTTPSGRQYFRDLPMKRWTTNRFGADENPITNTSRFYSYDPWQPWLTPGVSVTTSIDAEGWFTIRSAAPAPREGEPAAVVTAVAPTGVQATITNLNASGRTLARTRIEFTAVPAIAVPPPR